MEFVKITSHEELTGKIKDLEKSYLMLYKSGSATSDCALQNLAQVENDALHVFTADVSTVRDIHERYGIKTVPTLLAFEKDNYQNVVKGCNNPDFYRAFFENTAYLANDADGPRQPSVTVYSTPSCSWCTTLKTHLRRHNIRFTDIDVSRDQSMAEELVRKSGQQGVPQTEIDGEIIVGFDKARINRLLNIN
ncbi:MAG: thioredoxin family protein [Bacteroidales bacterium]|nr:thioredoxin family protein [Bacteroidales bacterium]